MTQIDAASVVFGVIIVALAIHDWLTRWSRRRWRDPQRPWLRIDEWSGAFYADTDELVDSLEFQRQLDAAQRWVERSRVP